MMETLPDPLLSDLLLPDPLLRCRGLARTFPGPPEVVALRSADLDVFPSEMVAIVGSSGSGKSTLLNLLGCLDSPTGGSYTIRGREVASLSEAERCARRSELFGFVFQSFHLLAHRPIEDNVGLSFLYTPRNDATVSVKERRARINDVLAEVGLSHRRGFLPSTLSGGERQRVAIARALVSGPSVLFCDEPTGNLDRTNGEQVLVLFEALRARGMSVVIVTHDLLVANRCDRVFSMADGILDAVGDRTPAGSSSEVASA